MNFTEALKELVRAGTELERENAELRRRLEVMARSNDELCDRVFELERMAGMRREVMNDE